MNKLLAIAAASILLSSTAFASTVIEESNTSFSTGTYQSKADAYNAGFDIVDNLKTMTNGELRNELSLYNDTFVRDITINNSKVTVTEYSNVLGEINYKALVNVDYNYKANESE